MSETFTVLVPIPLGSQVSNNMTPLNGNRRPKFVTTHEPTGIGVCRPLSRYPLFSMLMTMLGLFLAVQPSLSALEAKSEQQYFHFRLDPRESCRIWEIWFDLSDREIKDGVFLVGRKVWTSDSLGLVRETLTRTRYKVKLILSRGFMLYGSGGLSITLQKGTPAFYERLPPPVDLELATAPRAFPFQCRYEGTQVAVSVYKRSSGAALFERIFHEHCLWEIPHEPLVVGGRYLLTAAQSDDNARYSIPGTLGFRIEATQESCGICKGIGWLGALPATSKGTGRGHGPGLDKQDGLWPGTKGGFPVRNKPLRRVYSEVCPYCRGTGVRLSPFPVPEPALP